MEQLLCTSCNSPIDPKEASVKFPCPNCGSQIIIRCERCRKLTVEYECKKCGFKGP